VPKDSAANGNSICRRIVGPVVMLIPVWNLLNVAEWIVSILRYKPEYAVFADFYVTGKNIHELNGQICWATIHNGNHMAMSL
jgi:hypothetical protein